MREAPADSDGEERLQQRRRWRLATEAGGWGISIEREETGEVTDGREGKDSDNSKRRVVSHDGDEEEPGRRHGSMVDCETPYNNNNNNNNNKISQHASALQRASSARTTPRLCAGRLAAPSRVFFSPLTFTAPSPPSPPRRRECCHPSMTPASTAEATRCEELRDREGEGKRDGGLAAAGVPQSPPPVTTRRPLTVVGSDRGKGKRGEGGGAAPPGVAGQGKEGGAAAAAVPPPPSGRARQPHAGPRDEERKGVAGRSSPAVPPRVTGPRLAQKREEGACNAWLI